MSQQKNKAYDPFDDFEGFFKQAQDQLTFWVERAKIEFTEEVVDRMKELAVTKSELAKRLDAKPGFVTRLLSGGNNFELTTMVRLARALQSDFRCHLQPMGTNTCWLDVLVLKEDPKADWNPGEFRRIVNGDFSGKAENASVTAAA